MFTHDPVCGRRVSRRKAHAVVGHGGQAYFLCSPLCRMLFEHDPSRHLAEGGGITAGPTDSLRRAFETPRAGSVRKSRLLRALGPGSGVRQITG